MKSIVIIKVLLICCMSIVAQISTNYFVDPATDSACPIYLFPVAERLLNSDNELEVLYAYMAEEGGIVTYSLTADSLGNCTFTNYKDTQLVLTTPVVDPELLKLIDTATIRTTGCYNIIDTVNEVLKQPAIFIVKRSTEVYCLVSVFGGWGQGNEVELYCTDYFKAIMDLKNIYR